MAFQVGQSSLMAVPSFTSPAASSAPSIQVQELLAAARHVQVPAVVDTQQQHPLLNNGSGITVATVMIPNAYREKLWCKLS
jgi:hypothetical protein